MADGQGSVLLADGTACNGISFRKSGDLAHGPGPRHADYGLSSQLNRAVNSIGLNIAEGSGKSSPRAFDYHWEVAIGTAFEVVAGSFLACDRGYLAEQEQVAIYDDGQRLARAIYAFRHTLNGKQTE